VPEPPARDSSSDPLLSRRLRRLIASLSYKARLVMILRYQEDLMPDEIAAAMGMPVATVKSHLQRSLATLREKMARMIGAVRQ
jgi:RNA polymerase sigma-70 factor (ECF subfamily)